MWIKAKNDNVVEVEDADLAKRALEDGHEVFVSDPSDKGAKPKKWEPEADAAEGSDSK